MLAGSFLGGAGDRLLPATIPFRYFCAGSLFHIAAWVGLFLGAGDLADFTGGTGLLLAAIHLLTLGMFAMIAFGAAFQLLPVATRQPLAATWPARLSFWLLGGGTLVLSYGMAQTNIFSLNFGAALVALAFAVFAILTADNLRRAGALAIVAAHGWLSLLALVGFVGLGLAISLDFEFGFLPDHQALAYLHMMLATFGFMGVLALGFSLVLVPMFALARAPGNWPGILQLGFAAVAIALATINSQTALPGLGLATALAAGLSGGIYIWHMWHILRSGMRKRLGLSFVLIRLSWAFLAAALLVGLMLPFDQPLETAPALFGFLALVGWLLTFLTGILQRIAPFLASMHSTGKGGLPPLMSDLTPDLPLKLHAAGHIAALILCLAGILWPMPLLVQIGAVSGAAGAVAYAWFIFSIAIRLRRQPGTS